MYWLSRQLSISSSQMEYFFFPVLQGYFFYFCWLLHWIEFFLCVCQVSSLRMIYLLFHQCKYLITNNALAFGFKLLLLIWAWNFLHIIAHSGSLWDQKIACSCYCIIMLILSGLVIYFLSMPLFVSLTQITSNIVFLFETTIFFVLCWVGIRPFPTYWHSVRMLASFSMKTVLWQGPVLLKTCCFCAVYFLWFWSFWMFNICWTEHMIKMTRPDAVKNFRIC